MRRLTSVLMAAMLVVSAFAAVPAITMAQETATPDGETATPPPDAETETSQADEGNDTEANETTENGTDPGAQLAGVVSVGEAELDGELQSRTFGIRVAQAASDGAKADVVGEQLNDSEERLQELQQRRETLKQARENGSMSEGEYRAKIARLHAETKHVERLANETDETAGQIPAETLEERGVNATRITMLSERASELSGAEVAEIARGIAGQNAGEQARPGQAGDGGGADTEDRPGNVTDRDGQNGGADTPDNGATEAAGDTDTSPDGADAPATDSADSTETTSDGSTTDRDDTAGNDRAGSDSSNSQ